MYVYIHIHVYTHTHTTRAMKSQEQLASKHLFCVFN